MPRQIDVHNYARWNGGIIGQGGPTDHQFSGLWQKLASRYASKGSQMVFGVMNEPHDLNITTWRKTVQGAVNSIRNVTGNNNNIILIPGTLYCSAGAFVSESTEVTKVSNPDGSKTNLILDVHQYLDADYSGQSTECTSSLISGFQGLANYLRSNGRKALLSETGGGNTDSCVKYTCPLLDFLNSNSDVFLGWTSWAAGSFDASYHLTETPQNGVDTRLVTQCFKAKFSG
ncbi:hypothetical protein FH972_026277 [Carpinus fangiana]|uniref:Glycoside hydrolase family 5 domain-containing protein n=1 Tax=Carpinus fangiana TaxID=176857 RepID=A0A5N6L411_9ROSI|nr:hypothetical protein FH972_026277 [Carpinus fangiana]